MRFTYKIFVSVVLLFVTWQASADLLVAPTRVSFEQRDRTQQVVLINSGQKKRTYRLEWVEQSPNEYGAYSPVEDKAFKSASQYLRFSPRQVTLEPGERQVVKLLARRKNDMDDGEYRSHLKFVILPEVDDTSSGRSGVSMKLNLFLSYSIPVILKNGDVRVDPKIDDVQFGKSEDGKLDIEVSMSKSTPFGATGNVSAYFKDRAGNLTQIAVLNGVNFFHEQTVRKAKLIQKNNLPSTDGSIVVRYTGAQEFAGQILAEREFSI